DWAAFLDYNERMWNSLELEVDSVSMEIARYVMQPPRPALTPVTEWFKIITAGLMPKRIRHQYQFAFGVLERAGYDASIQGIRLSYPLLPGYMKYAPNYYHARWRASGKGVYDPTALRVEQAIFGKTRASAAA